MAIKYIGRARVVRKHIPNGSLGRPNLNPPLIVVQDNAQLLSFTLVNDMARYTWMVPDNFAGGDLEVAVHWTNDGGVDDLNRDINFQLDYQTVRDGLPISGSHVNSPLNVEDTYTLNTGWEHHTTDYVTIAEADFDGRHMIYMRISFIAPGGLALTCEPHLCSVMLRFREYVLLFQ